MKNFAIFIICVSLLASISTSIFIALEIYYVAGTAFVCNLICSVFCVATIKTHLEE